jgi:hypothetical protein
MQPGKKLTISALFILMAALGGCSSVPPSEDGLPLDMGGFESGADAVGSIPEDMLADEDLHMGDDFFSSGSAGDPFADLTGGQALSSSDALAVSEPDDPFVSFTSGGGTDSYVVKAGDTLMKIAFTIYGDIDRWKDLFDWNRGVLKKASQLRVGMKLSYEAPLSPFSPSSWRTPT